MSTSVKPWCKVWVGTSNLGLKGCLVVVLLLVLPSLAVGKTASTNSTIIDIDVARYVATEHVHANNRPYQWRALDHVVLYDLDGTPNGYAFIFAKAESQFKEPADLNKHITGVSARLLAKKEKPKGNSDGGKQEVEVNEDSLYAFDNLATVITGATSDSRLIIRHFRGAPQFWIEAEKLAMPTSANRYGKTLRPTHVVMITPMDFRLVATEDGVGAVDSRMSRKSEKTTLSDTVMVVNVQAKTTTSMKDVRKMRQKIKDRNLERLEKMKPADRERYEKATNERGVTLAKEWQKIKEQYNANDLSEGVGQ